MRAPDAADGLPAQTDVTGAMERVLQRLASTEAVSSVSVKTFTTSGSVIEGALQIVAHPLDWEGDFLRTGDRHFATVGIDRFNSPATSTCVLPSPHNRTIQAPPLPAWRASPLLQRVFLSSSERVSGWVERPRRIVDLHLDTKRGTACLRAVSLLVGLLGAA